MKFTQTYPSLLLLKNGMHFFVYWTKYKNSWTDVPVSKGHEEEKKKVFVQDEFTS